MLNAEQLQALKTLSEAGKVFLAADGGLSSVNHEDRTVDVVWFTGIDVPRTNWWTGEQYVLRFDPKGADLSLLNNGAPVLDNHSSWNGAADQKGRVEKAWSEGGKFLGKLRFSKRPEVDGLWTDIEDKIVTKFSMGVEILESTEKRDDKGRLLMKTANKWRPFELSVAPIPADFNTTTLSNDVLRATAQFQKEAPSMDPTNESTGGEARKEEEAAKLRAEGARLERERQAGIEQLCGPFLKRGEMDAAFIAQLKGNDQMTVEMAKGEILSHLAKRSAENPIQHQHGEIVRDETQTRRDLMTAALLNRIDAKNKVDEQNDFRRMTCLRMAEEALSRAGIRTRGLAPAEIAKLAMHNTADFPYVLENTARKQLLVAYETAAPTYRQWTAPSTSPDFKTMSRVQLSEAPSFLQVPEGGEIKMGTMSDKREQYALATYGRGISFTRQMLINDDLGAFNRLVFAFGLQAGRLENKTIYAILTANANLADGVALFHAGHGNLGAGVIGNTGLDAMFIAMGTQKGMDGETILNLTPQFLIVPKAKEATARAAMTAVGPSVKMSDQNMFAGRLTVVADGELDGNSTTVWYGAADPALAPAIEYCHLEGASGPQVIRKENEGGILGVTLYAFLDFAGKALDHRPLYKSSGV